MKNHAGETIVPRFGAAGRALCGITVLLASLKAKSRLFLAEGSDGINARGAARREVGCK
jgi:hypothetical protein